MASGQLETSTKNPCYCIHVPFLYFSGGGINCISYDRCVYRYSSCLCFFPWGIPPLQSDWSLSCDHGLDYAS